MKLSEVCDDVAIACRLVLALYSIRRSRQYKRLKDSRMMHWVVCGDGMSRNQIEREQREAEEEAKAEAAKAAKVPSPKSRRS